jgi:hypothetical protein
MSDHYGKHSRAHASGLSVAELLRRAVARGEAIRLAWRGTEATSMADPSQDFPTAILPAIRDEYPGDDEETEPRPGVRAGGKWFRPERSLCWLSSMAG